MKRKYRQKRRRFEQMPLCYDQHDRVPSAPNDPPHDRTECAYCFHSDCKHRPLIELPTPDNFIEF